MPTGIYKRKPHTEETRKKLSLSHIGMKVSEETKRKIKETKLKQGIIMPDHIKKMLSLKNKGNTYALGIKHTDEWKLQAKIRSSGENSPCYIKDRTKLKTGREKSYDTQYKYWMRKVKNRDLWKCKMANEDCKGKLEAHHILDWENYPELRYDINNGITLCHAHHPRGRDNEAKLSPYFQQLVAEMK